MTLDLAKQQQTKLNQEVASCDSTIVEYASRKEIAQVQLDALNALIAKLTPSSPAPEPLPVAAS